MDSYTIQVLKYIDTFIYVQTHNAPTFTYRDLSKVSPKYIHIYIYRHKYILVGCTNGGTWRDWFRAPDTDTGTETDAQLLNRYSN